MKPYDLQLGSPPLDAATIAWLNRLYPDCCPTPDMSEREIWMAAGQRQLVNKLIQI